MSKPIDPDFTKLTLLADAYRCNTDLRVENATLKAENVRLRAENAALKSRNEGLEQNLAAWERAWKRSS